MMGSALLGLACGAFATASEATWDPVGGVDSSTEVNNEGTTVLAMMVNSGGPVTVNGVTFLNWENKTQNGVTAGYTGGPGSTFQDVDYFITGSPNSYFSGPTTAERDAFIHAMAGARDGVESLTFSGLTVGQRYLVQVWAVDMRSNPTVNGYYTLSLDGGVPSGQLEYFGPGGGLSSHVVGRFTADATTCALTLGDTNRPQFNAIQLRAIPPGDPPTAGFNATPTQGVVPLEVAFTDNSTAGSGAIVSRHWDFGDGNSTTTAETSVTHNYTDRGSYTVTLTVTAEDDLSDSFSQIISVVSAEPTAAFSASPMSGFAPLEVTFTDTSDPGSSAIVSRHWDFGDGNSSTTGATNLTHAYDTAGIYIVTLTVTNDDGYSDNTNQSINVAQPASITWEPVVTSGGGVKFDSTGVNNEGATVLALMVNSGGPTMVNGVTFLNWENKTQNGVTVGYTGGPGTTFQGVNYFITGSPNDYFSGPTDAERDAYIHAMAGARDGVESITFSGLTLGQEYLVQVWAVDMRNNPTVNGRYTLALDGGTPSGELQYFGPGGGLSSYVIGRFTADQAACELTLGNASRPQFNAVQLRAITTTEPSKYEEWQARFPGHDLVDHAADYDGDGMVNFQEFAFGLDPTSAVSANPVTHVGDLATHGQFIYTRFANSGLTYKIWISTDLVNWEEEPDAIQEPSAPDEKTGSQTVMVKLVDPPHSASLFIRVKAE